MRNSGADLTNKYGKSHLMCLDFLTKTIKLLLKGIVPVYVFDGKPPDIKRKVLDLRKNIRKKAEEKWQLVNLKRKKLNILKEV